MNTSALLLKNFARRSALLTKRASPCITTALSRRFSSQQKVEEEVPPEDYYDGHLMADHLEYLDDMIEKTVELKESMEELKQSKLSAIEKASSGVKWIETAEIDRLFEQTSAQKAALGEQLEELKVKMAEARKTYAVDSPDGYSDAWEKEEMEEIKHIIDDAAAHEDKEEVERFHKQQEEAAKTFAVDAPGTDCCSRMRTIEAI